MVLASQVATASLSTRTACPFCGAGCSVLLEDGVAYPPVSDPITHGGLCLRGWSNGELLRSPLRILRPRVRVRGDPRPSGAGEGSGAEGGGVAGDGGGGGDSLCDLCPASAYSRKNHIEVFLEMRKLQKNVETRL